MSGRAPLPANTAFALLDDQRSGGAASRLYAEPSGTIEVAADASDGAISAALTAVESALAAGRHVVWLSAYELGCRLQRSGERGGDPATPLLVALLFDRVVRLDADGVDAWLAQQASMDPAGVLATQLDDDEDAFTQAVALIRDWCAAGDTYQVNYTTRLRCDAYGDPVALYRRLRARQPVAFGALIHLPQQPQWRWILSCSPELFVRRTGTTLTTQPMKGTATIADVGAESLAADPKNRTENLMIVDLLRNDLGRIAQPGSVTVPELFAVAAHGEVWQMTSTITATAQSGLGLAPLLQALYPCGSITGAPKHRTMALIRALEPSARGLYTGALGWLEPPAAAGERLGDLALSVPIRTLVVDAHGRGELGVGAGITHDSIAADEYRETLLKAQFVTRMPAACGLFETLAVRTGVVAERDAHRSRLQQSALALQIPFDAAAVDAAMDAAAQTVAAAPLARLRVDLAADGAVRAAAAAIEPLTSPQSVCLAATRLPVGDPLRRYKTTARAAYDAGWQHAEALGCFDALFFDAAGTLLEGGRSTVFLWIDGRWLTPALDAGVLPGVARAQLLASGKAVVADRLLTVDDLRAAEAIAVANALRGWVPVALVDTFV